nr:aminotransferase class III-fold pyridoxal phosphate-dependent enzyme [Clostridiales bacterium]
KGVEKLCKEKDMLLVIDEVQTGNGRTGQLYCYMDYGIKPDIVTTAKGLAGGLPIGAAMFGEKTENTLCAGSHGSTFGGNPVCAAGANCVLSMITDELLSEVREKSDYIKSELSGAEGIKSVCGMGLMLGIETEKNAKDVVNECLKNGVVCLTAKSKVRLLPALNIPFDDLKCAIAVLKEAVK